MFGELHEIRSDGTIVESEHDVKEVD